MKEAEEPLDCSGAWAELLGDVRGWRVLVDDRTGSRAAALLLRGGARVVPVDVLTRDPAGCATLDAVLLAGVPVDAGLLSGLRRRLAPHGLLLLVSSAPRSPLRVLDAARQGRGRPGRRQVGQPLRSLRRAAQEAGLATHAFGVLRSVDRPTTLFSLQERGAARLVLGASNGLNTGLRARAVRALRALAGRGLAAPLVPGVALLCGAPVAGLLPEPPVLGRIGPDDASEAKLVVGEPVRELVKVYSRPAACAAEVAALRAVGRVRPGLVPEVLERLADDRVRLSWLPGRSLPLAALSAADVDHWVGEAAALLGELHRELGLRPDGQRLVHGDYWLGNLLVDGCRVVGVLDWGGAGPGSGATDLAFLVDSWVARRGLGSAAAAALREVADQRYARGLSAG